MKTRHQSGSAVGLLVLLALCCIPTFAHAQDSTMTPEARPEDVASIESIIEAAMASFSGPAGEAPDWDRFRSLFKPHAQFITISQDGTAYDSKSVDAETIISDMNDWLVENGFFEKPVHFVTERFGPIGHAFVTYETRRDPEAAEPSSRGMSSFQLLHDGARWWIVNWFWTGEHEGVSVPPEYR